MYWGQMAVGVAVAIATAYALASTGRPTTVAIAGAVIVYSVVRWLLAWAYRTRFWVRQGGHGHRVQCPNCHAHRHRIGGDWILRCKQCGWKEGLPLLRWVTRSVPARQLRRTVVGPKLVVVVIAAAVIAVGGVPGVGAIVSDDILHTGVNNSSGGFQFNIPSFNGTERGPEWQQGYNRTKVRHHFIEYLNKERSDRRRQNLSHSQVLTEMGRNHSRNMARHEYMGHVEPGGIGIQDRYEGRGLLPKCRLPIEGTDEYYPGAENVAKVHVDTTLRVQWGMTEEYDVYNEEELAFALFQIWYYSRPHLEAMVVASADEVGLGLYITDDDTAYASLELC